MSANGDDGPGRREVAYRLFAAEFDDADFEYKESDEERAPNYVITPTGARVNRLFVVGVLTEVESVSDDVLRGRVVDPTGAFVLYAGQYQQDERAFLDRAEPPAFVAVTGKARTFQPEDSDRVFTSVRPESLSTVDAATRDRWTVDAAEQTVSRVRAMATAIALDAEGDRLEEALVDRGVEEGLADGIVQALDHYGTTPTYLAAVRDLAVDAARHVAGELDEVPGFEATPTDPGDVVVTDLLDEPIEPLSAGADTAESTAATDSNGPDDSTPEGDALSSEPDGTDVDVEPEPEAVTATTEDTDEDRSSEAVEPATDADEPADGGRDDTAPEEEPADAVETPEATDTAETGETADAAETTETADTTKTTETADTTETTETTETADDEDGPGDFDPGEFELDEEEREEIEAEYGTEFQSGTEVDEPGEADIETPDPEDVPETESERGDTDSETAAAEPDTTDSAQTAPEPTGASDTSESASGAESETEPGTEGSEDAEAADLDLVDVVVDVMGELDEGDGADREAVVETVTDRHGADRDAVEEAIQEALMDGRCYEPDDGVLTPI